MIVKIKGLIAGIGINNAHAKPANVQQAASTSDIPVEDAATQIAYKSPPNTLTQFARCMEKSTPTPTRIEPIITVTKDNSTSIISITIHCIATVKTTGRVVKNA